MPLFYDSDQDWSRIAVDANQEADDISAYSLEVIWYQNGKEILTLTQGSGVEFDTDGTDGAFTISMTAAQSKLFRAGPTRVEVRNVAGSNRRMIWEGQDTVEGPAFDA